MTIRCSPELEAAAEALPFAESAGGPVIVIGCSAAKGWWGVFDADGNAVDEGADIGGRLRDYDRACESDLGVIECGGRSVIVMPEPEPTAFYPTDDGGLLVRWVGADSAAGLVAAALSIADDEWQDVGAVFVSDGEGCMIMDAAADGRADDNDVAVFQLPAGSYAVKASAELDVEVDIGGVTESVMAAVIKLERR